MGNNFKRAKITYTENAVSGFLVSAGAAGFVDTDISSATGTDPTRVWLVAAKAVADQAVGIRPHGSTVTHTFTTNAKYAVFLTRVDSSGHADLYRGAADVTYYTLGYIE